MKFIKFISILLLLTTNIFAKEDIINIQLKDGIVKIKTFDDKAPKHVKRIKELVSEGFYDGIVFHRVIDGFMAQTGDPLGNGTGGSGQNIEQEFNDTPHINRAIFHRIAFFNFVNKIHSFNDLTPGSILTIKVRSIIKNDKKLTISTIRIT